MLVKLSIAAAIAISALAAVPALASETVAATTGTRLETVYVIGAIDELQAPQQYTRDPVGDRAIPTLPVVYEDQDAAATSAGS